MDKKNLIIGMALLVAAFAIMLVPRNAPPQQPRPAQYQPAPAGASQPPSQSAYTPAATQTAAPAQTAAAPGQPQLVVEDDGRPEIETLENDFIEVHFTKQGGAVQSVGFKEYPLVKNSPEPYVFNAGLRPLLAIGNDTYDGVKIDGSVNYRCVEKTDTRIVYVAEYAGYIRIRRTYTIAPAGARERSPDPYQIRHEITFENLKDRGVPAQSFTLNVGTAMTTTGHSFGPSLSGGYFEDVGRDSHFIDIGSFSSGGFLGLTTRVVRDTVPFAGSIRWASVSNQFFTGILTARDQSVGGSVLFAHNPNATEGPGTGIGASVAYTVPALAANGSEATLAFDYYVGPKEYTRLARRANFPNSEADVMQFANGWYRKIMLSGAISPFMNWLMTRMHKVIGNWGLAIILMTILLKTVTLPFTLAASRSAKRMQKLTPELTVLREKYKDNPQKLNQATMELWKKHKINPLGGCLPVLITMPLFVAFFFMLQSAPELRFQSFLWARDLSAPDTVWHLPWVGFPLNIMPLLMGATMVIQMRLTPSPGVDNAQAKMMKFMPVIFTFICYNFSCALALYSAVNGLFTIGQQLVVNRMKDKTPVPATATATAGSGQRPMKNVTPRRKK